MSYRSLYLSSCSPAEDLISMLDDFSFKGIIYRNGNLSVSFFGCIWRCMWSSRCDQDEDLGETNYGPDSCVALGTEDTHANIVRSKRL